MSAKPKVAFYWCSSCGGCEEALLDLNDGFLDVASAVDIVLWPAALDFKYHHIETMADNEIAVSFINGAVRTDEQAHVAKLLRQKSGLIVAFGSCAHLGGIPGLANLTSKKAIFDRSYFASPTVVNDEKTEPKTASETQGKEITLPAFWEQVFTLDQVIDVDYYLPGCPPMPQDIGDAVGAILSGRLPEKGAVLAPVKALCDTCERRKTKGERTRLRRIYRPFEIEADPKICLLEQGIICMGPATRGGCGEACIQAGMPCTGCYGPPPGVEDQGAKMLAALASLFEGRTEEDARAMAEQVLDPAGTFSRYSVAASLPARKL